MAVDLWDDLDDAAMDSDDSELGLRIWSVVSNLQLIAVALAVLASLAGGGVDFIQSFGVPKWIAIGLVALFPVACWSIVRFSGRRQHTTSLSLSTTSNLDGPSRDPAASRVKSQGPSGQIPRVVPERNRDPRGASGRGILS